MTRSITMHLTKEELKGILTEYFKEELKEEVKVEVKIIKTTDYREACEITKLCVSYTKNEMIMNHIVSVTVCLKENEMKSILSTLIEKYEVSYIIVDNLGITLNLIEKQKKLERRPSGYDFR